MGAVAGRAEHTFPVSSQSLLLSLQGPLPVSVSLRHGSNVSLHPQSPGASLLSETGQSLRNKAASQQRPEDTDGIGLQADSGEGAAGSGHPPPQAVLARQLADTTSQCSPSPAVSSGRERTAPGGLQD